MLDHSALGMHFHYIFLQLFLYYLKKWTDSVQTEQVRWEDRSQGEIGRQVTRRDSKTGHKKRGEDRSQGEMGKQVTRGNRKRGHKQR